MVRSIDLLQAYRSRLAATGQQWTLLLQMETAHKGLCVQILSV